MAGAEFAAVDDFDPEAGAVEHRLGALRAQDFDQLSPGRALQLCEVAAGLIPKPTELRVYHMELTLGRSEADSALRRAGALKVDEGKNGRLRVTVPEGLAPSALFDAVQNAGGAVRQMHAHRRTLEEVFLGALQEESAR